MDLHLSGFPEVRPENLEVKSENGTLDIEDRPTVIESELSPVNGSCIVRSPVPITSRMALQSTGNNKAVCRPFSYKGPSGGEQRRDTCTEELQGSSVKKEVPVRWPLGDGRAPQPSPCDSQVLDDPGEGSSRTNRKIFLDKQTRPPRFSERENERLVNGVISNYQAILGPQAARTKLATKRRIWQEITDNINSLEGALHTVEVVRKHWEEARLSVKRKMEQEIEAKRTGGGFSVHVDYSPWERRLQPFIYPAARAPIPGAIDTSDPSRLGAAAISPASCQVVKASCFSQVPAETEEEESVVAKSEEDLDDITEPTDDLQPPQPCESGGSKLNSGDVRVPEDPKGQVNKINVLAHYFNSPLAIPPRRVHESCPAPSLNESRQDRKQDLCGNMKTRVTAIKKEIHDIRQGFNHFANPPPLQHHAKLSDMQKINTAIARQAGDISRQAEAINNLTNVISNLAQAINSQTAALQTVAEHLVSAIGSLQAPAQNVLLNSASENAAPATPPGESCSSSRRPYPFSPSETTPKRSGKDYLCCTPTPVPYYGSKGEALFVPRFIRHPRSAEWTPPDHIACYLQVWMRKALDKEVRNKHRAECSCPTIPECRKAALFHIDVRLTDMTDKELGPKAEGKLFGDPFIVELRKHAGTYTTMNKVETSLKKVFQPQGVFHRAGRQRG
ncbi:uncharacterized protein WCC33_010101 [Rhinophrynus dorsalis]